MEVSMTTYNHEQEKHQHSSYLYYCAFNDDQVAVIDHVLFCTRPPSLLDLFACFTPICPLPLPYHHHFYYYYHLNLLVLLRPTKDTSPS